MITGGISNTIDTGSPYAFIGGGERNYANGFNAVVVGGEDDSAMANKATIVGGTRNVAGGAGSFIGAGINNRTALNDAAVVAGAGNTNYSYAGFIGAGRESHIDSNRFHSAIVSGYRQHIAATDAFIGGGSRDSIFGSGNGGAILGGGSNSIDGPYASIVGGFQNSTSGAYTTILGGRGLSLNGSYSVGFLGNPGGSFPMEVNNLNVALLGNVDLWLASNDGSASELRLFEPNATTGVFPGATEYTSFEAGAQTANLAYILPTTAPAAAGDDLEWTGAMSGGKYVLQWGTTSSPLAKQNFARIEPESVLAKFRGLDIGSWEYIDDATGKRHYGVMADDFHAAFGNDGLGEIGDPTRVNDIDLHGISYLAIKGLIERTEQLTAEVERLRKRVAELER